MSSVEKTEQLRPERVDRAIQEIAAAMPERIVTSRSVREQHGASEGFRDAAVPDAVVFARSNDEVSAVVAICNANQVPITAFGAGTSLEGQLQSTEGGVCIDLSRMDKVIEINADDLDCRVQAGVTRERLNAELRDVGMFFPVDPGANATIGGMAATGASGTTAVRYGTMRELALGMTVVTAEGAVIRTGGRARKSSAGYDLTRLFVGSEGTLGIITEVQLRLFGIPETIAAATCQFDDLTAATSAVIMAIQLGVPLARIELLDEVMMKACISYGGLDAVDAKPSLFLEFHGTPTAVAEQTEQMRAIVSEFGAASFRSSSSAEERNRLWKARHNAYYAARSMRPGSESFSTDACVPISRLADVIAATKEQATASGLDCPIVGHVGDGNYHVFVNFNPGSAGERAAAEELVVAIARRSIAAGGTCTGEHGIGRHKRELLLEEHGAAVDMMRQIKRSLDPLDILNPGCTLPLPG